VNFQDSEEQSSVTEFINHQKTLLSKLLKELEELATVNNDDRAIVALDQQSVGRLSRMDAMQRQQIALETQRRRALEKAQIAAALRRIAEEEYGWCADCGNAIGHRRLEVRPTAHLCFECAV
jgi:DnaK suppressor protein